MSTLEARASSSEIEIDRQGLNQDSDGESINDQPKRSQRTQYIPLRREHP